MRPISFVVLALLFLPQSIRAELNLGGHAKYQFSFRHFEPDELGYLLTGSDSYLNSGDVRLNSTYRRGPWDLTVQGQFLILQGSLLKAAEDPSLGDVASTLFPLVDPSDSKQVLNLSWIASEGNSHLLFGRLDRLSLGFSRGPLSLRVGRQVSSWGNGIVFQVLDLFNPFPPNAVDTEYKPGIDMVSGQWLFSNGDDLQVALIPRRIDRSQALSSSESSGAAKWRHYGSSLQLELLGAYHYRSKLFGLGLSGNLAGGVWRFDFSETLTEDDDLVTSFLVNMDRSWVVADRNLYGFIEYFRNGYGESSLAGGVEMLESGLLRRLSRGELFSLGSDELATGLRFEWTPLTQLEPTFLVNLTDASTYFLFKFHHDCQQNLALDAGFQVGLGGRGTEYGGLYSTETESYIAPGRVAWLRLAEYF